MTFAYPWVLLFLAIPVLLLIVPPSRSFGLAMPFDNHVHPRRRRYVWLLGAFDRVAPLLLAAVVLMLADPQTLKQPKEKRSLTNIMFCMDVSGSMGAENRYKNARDAVEEFIKVREGDAFGLTIFAERQVRWVPLTKDLNAIRNALPFANPEKQSAAVGGGTAIGAALLFCRDNMIHEAVQGDRMLILVSDGGSSDFGPDYGKELADAKITFFHIHIGSDTMPQEVIEIANKTGGQAFAARDKSALKHIFEHIDRMKPAQFLPSGTVPMDNYKPFAIAALALLSLRMVWMFGVRHTPW